MKLPQWREAQRRIGGAASDAGRIGAVGDAAQLLAQEAAQQGDAAVAGAQVLGRMRRDRALAHLRFVVAGKVAVLGFAQLPPELAVHLRAHPADVARLLDPAGDVDAEVRVVDRQHPADRLDRAVPAEARARHDAQRRQRRLGDAPAGACRRRACASSRRARRARSCSTRPSGICAIAGTNWWPEKTPCRIGTWKLSTTFSKCCSQLHGMICGPPPPRLESSASSDSPGASCVEDVDARQQRLPVGRAEVGEDQAVALLERIPRLAHVAA